MSAPSATSPSHSVDSFITSPEGDKAQLSDETDKLLAGFTDVTKQLREQGKRDNKKREKIEQLILSKARRRLQRRRFLMFWKKGPDESMLYDHAFQQMLIGRKERGHRDDDLLYHPTTKRILLARGYNIQS